MEARTRTGAHCPPAPSAGRPPKPRRRIPRAAIVAVAACLAVVLGAGTAWAYNYTKLDLTWYTNNRDASEFTVSTAGQMQAFSALVNGDAVDVTGNPMEAVSFEGKTVRLANGVSLAFTGEFTPIGTDAHPFEGTFDGQGKDITGLSIKSGTTDIGLFGVAGERSILRNVSIGDSGVVQLSSGDTAFEDVGSLVGDCRGSIENSTSRAQVTVEYTGTDVAGSVMKSVGGVAGSVKGSVTGTSFGGSLRAETPANAYTGSDGSSVATVVENVGGIVGTFGGNLSGCTNSGTMVVVTSGASGVDRFGATVEAKSLYVGGVGGYGEGNVTDCHNTATLFTTSVAGATLDDIDSDKAKDADGGADALGGVVGSLRGIAMSGLGDNRGDAGLEEGALELVLSNCSNTGYVAGLHTVGGIVGSQGSNTVVTRCVNGTAGTDGTSSVGHVRTTRWNKPAGGGIAGQSWGVISYSRNHGQSENTKTGYFTAGICGMLEKHEAQKSTPEIYACYNTGNVFTFGTAASFYVGGIVGENDHGCYVHDNVFLSGTVASSLTNRDDEEDVAAGRNYGTVANTTVVYETAKQAAEKKGIAITSGEAVAILNKLAANDDWANYYFITKGANKGYPVLNGEASPDGRIDLAGVAYSIEFVKNAKYTAAYNPTPTLKVTVTIDGMTKELVQGSDYKVVADPSALGADGICKGLTNGEKPYQATIEGIGNYYGSPAQKTAYGIDRGEFNECTVSVVSGKWTGEPLNSPAVSVTDAGGSIVSADDYTFVVNDGEDCVKTGNYPVVATAKDESNYQGTASGTYAIDQVDIYKDADVVGFTYENRVWYYDEDKTDYYEVIPADATGAALPEGADLLYDEQGLPYVVPQTYTDPDTGREAQRSTYVNEDGRTLTVAEAKRQDAGGKPVYGDMAVDFTGTSIQPTCLGVLYDGKLLQGVRESDLPSIKPEDTANVKYVVRYGGTGDGGTMAKPLNTNATTSVDQPEASIVVRGYNMFTNYAYVDFKINAIEGGADNIKVVQKTASLDYAAGGLPPAPETKRDDAVGNVNQAVEVRYAPDPAKYDAQDASTYYVLDGANWKLEFDHGTTADGTPITDAKAGYVAGSLVYFKVVPTDQCSVKGWDAIAIPDAWEVASSKVTRFDGPAVEVTVEQGKAYDPNDWQPKITAVNTATGETLVEGTHFAVSTAGLEAPRYNAATGKIEGSLRVAGKKAGGYTGTVSLDYTVEKGTLSADEASKLTWLFVDESQKATISSGDLLTCTALNWREGGWNADDLSGVLRLGWNAYPSTATENAFTVESIEKDGQLVSAVTEMGQQYTLNVRFNEGEGWYYTDVADGEVLRVPVTMEPVDLGSINPPLTIYSKAELSPSEYMYTGNAIVPQLKVYDAGGMLVNGSYFSFVYVEGGKGEPREVGMYNVPSEDSSNKGVYYDMRVTGDGVHYVRDTSTAADLVSGSTGKIFRASDTTNLSFEIMAADIADADKVRVEVGEAHYAAGQAAEPDVAFFDAQTGERLNYVKGSDYELAYRNNAQVGSALDDDPPIVSITPTDNGHLVVGGDAAASMDVPFTIQGDGADVADVAWDYAKQIVVHSDGTLSQPGVVGSVGDAACATGTYRVEVGTYNADAKSFTAKADGWKEGDEVFFRVTGLKEGVLTGTTVLSEPARAVAASEANTFKAGSATLAASAANTVYTGVAARPAVSAADGGTALVEGRDFKVESADVDAGAATAVVSGLGAYAGSMDAPFSIAQASMADLEVKAAPQVYAGKQITLASGDVTSVTLGGKELPAGDWALKADGYGANVNVADGATATLVPGTSGNLTGEKPFDFAIDPAPLVNDELVITSSNAVYTGAAVELAEGMVTIHDTARDRDLVFGEDFVASGYENNVNAGTATVYLSGAGNYSASANTVTKAFAIAPADFATATIEGVQSAYDWRGQGSAVQPLPIVSLGDATLPASDYAVSYGANDEIGSGTGTVVVTPSGKNVTGDAKTSTFDIAVDLARATVEAVPNGTYEPGASYEPEVKVSFNGVQLVEGTHYAVAYDADEDAGEKTLAVRGIAPCTGSKEVVYGIDGKSLDADMVDVRLDGWTYTGAAVEPHVTLTDGTEVLVEGTDYEVTYGNNVQATGGKASAVITVAGKGNYAGVLTKTFAIAPKPLTDPDIDAAAAAAGLFSGTAVSATVTATDAGYVPDPATGASYALAEGADYTLACSGNDAVGTATATMTGAGNYAGTLELPYRVKGDLTAARVAALPNAAYSGKAVEPEPAVTLAGIALKPGVDYEVSYRSNVQPGTAAVTLAGIGSYEGAKEASFVIETPSYTDPATGVTVSGTALVDLAADGARVKVDVRALASDDPLMVPARAAYGIQADAFLGFEVTLQTVADGKTVEVRDGFGQLTVSLPVDPAYNGRSATVAVRHTADDGTVTFETQRVTVTNGAVSLAVSKLSEFFVAVDKTAVADGGGTGGASESIGTSAGGGSALAPTGDGASGVLLAFAGLGAAALVLALMAFPAFFRKTGR